MYRIVQYTQADTLLTQTVTTQVATATPTILLRISRCESNNNPKAKNPLSSASGRFQFLKSSWKYYGKQLWGDKWNSKDIFDWNDNTELALYVYNRNGTKDWSASSSCWSKAS